MHASDAEKLAPPFEDSLGVARHLPWKIARPGRNCGPRPSRLEKTFDGIGEEHKAPFKGADFRALDLPPNEPSPLIS